MKRFIYALFIGFALITAYTFYKASSVYDGLVEPSYYERSKDWFETRKAEVSMGLAIDLRKMPVSAGTQEMAVSVRNAKGPLTSGHATLTLGRPSSSSTDRAYEAGEVSPGVYSASVELPERGIWLVRFELQHPSISTERRWTITIN